MGLGKLGKERFSFSEGIVEMMNFKLADWPKFNEEAERLVSQLDPPTSCGAGEKLFRKAITTAAKHHIPAGYRKNYVPGRTPEVVQLQNRYDALRELDPRDPDLEDLEAEIKRTCAAVQWLLITDYYFWDAISH